MSDYIEIGNDRAVRLDEYQNTFSISMHRQYLSKWYWQGCKVIIGKDQVADKTSPMKATLGNRQTAIYVLECFLKELRHGSQEDPQGPPAAARQQSAPPIGEDDGIPF
ncbi:MAG: hypothetical protein WC294_00240 [Methanoregula sp.]|jgi:hypothetical protein